MAHPRSARPEASFSDSSKARTSYYRLPGDLVRDPSGEGTPLLPWRTSPPHGLQAPPAVPLNRSIHLLYPIPDVGSVIAYVKESEVTLVEEERLYKAVVRRLKEHDMPSHILVELHRLYMQRARLRFFAKQQEERDSKFTAVQNETAELAVSINYGIGIHEGEVYELQKKIQEIDMLDHALGRSYYYEEALPQRSKKRAADKQQQKELAAYRKAEAAAHKQAEEAARKAAEAAKKRTEAEAAHRRAEEKASHAAAAKGAACRKAEAAQKQAAEQAARKKAQAASRQAEKNHLLLAATLEQEVEQQEHKQQHLAKAQQQHLEQQQLGDKQKLQLQLLRDAVLQEELSPGAAGLETLQSLIKQRQSILSQAPTEPFRKAGLLHSVIDAAAAATCQVLSLQAEATKPEQQRQLGNQTERRLEGELQPLSDEFQQQQQQKRQGVGLHNLSMKLRDCGEEVRQCLASGRLSAKGRLARAVHVDLVERLDSTSFDQVVQRYWSP